MLEAEICKEQEQRDDWHARWLAMQAAYSEYRRSSEALECTRHSSDDAVAGDHLRLAMLEGQQRLAFERYVDARIAFLESRFDEMNRPEADPGAPAAPQPGNPSRIKEWLTVASSRPVLQTLAVLLLCSMSFSLVREQKRVRDLEVGRDKLLVALQQTEHAIELMRDRMDAAEPRTAAPLVQRTPPAGANRVATGRRTGAGQPAKRAVQQHTKQQKTNGIRASVPATPARPSNGHTPHDFSLPPSREFKRVGPLSVWVKSIDPKVRGVSLSIVSETVEVDVPLLKINEPVWVHTAHGHLVGLVADRITATRLEGHLIDGENGKSDLRASRARPNIEGAP